MNKLEKILTQKTGRAIFNRRGATWAKRLESNQACQANHALLASIRRDAAPAIAACIKASDLLDAIGIQKGLYLGQDSERACRVAVGANGKYSFTYKMGQADNDTSLLDNCPIMAMGEAMATRDAQAQA